VPEVIIINDVLTPFFATLNCAESLQTFAVIFVYNNF
jgi:hypothetical protein